MTRYADEYGARFSERRWRGRRQRSAMDGGHPIGGRPDFRRPTDYDDDFGYRRRDGARARGPSESAFYGDEFGQRASRARLPHKPAHGYPVRGIHSYDLDYGSLGGLTNEYSGRMGYPVGPPSRISDEEYPPRGVYTPRLEEADRDRTLYGGVSPEYRGHGWRRRRRYGNRPGSR
jgi:hypothetical protein